MGDNTPDHVLSGSGGVLLGEGRTQHEGRRALLLTRDEASEEFKALVQTMGIDVVETILQTGPDDPKGFLGSGKLEDISEELTSSSPQHPWYGVDLILLHTNATPRQLVNVHHRLQLEIWDRVRLLLSLFTAHASSVEARLQVRIAQLQSDRSVLRELVHRETTGERAGFGAGGANALQIVTQNLNRELALLRKKQNRQSKAIGEHQRQRKKSGAKTVGLVGYTNAGKSTLFSVLSGKEVLIEDKLFSTLETTVGRFSKGPRILIADTIGFIDNIPNALLTAFKATFAEAIISDLLLVLIDATDSPSEIVRKMTTTLREIHDFHPVSQDSNDVLVQEQNLLLVCTKADSLSSQQIHSLRHLLLNQCALPVYFISAKTRLGMDELEEALFHTLYGHPLRCIVLPPTSSNDVASEKIISEFYEKGTVSDIKSEANVGHHIKAWIDEKSTHQLIHKWPFRIVLK